MVNWIICRDDNGENGWQDIPVFHEQVDLMFDNINEWYSNSQPKGYSLTCEPTYTHNYDTKIIFELNEIIFIDSTIFNSAWGSNTANQIIDYLHQNFPETENTLNHIFTQPNFSPSYWGYYYQNHNYAFIHTLNSMYSVSYVVWDDHIQHIAHEYGHAVGQHHTYGSEYTDIYHYDFLDDIFGLCPEPLQMDPNNLCFADCGQSGEPCPCIPPPDHVCHLLKECFFRDHHPPPYPLMSGDNNSRYISPKSAGRMHRALSIYEGTFIINNRPMHKYVKEKYSYQIPLFITEDETWDFAIKMYQDIVIESGNTLTITCDVLMPIDGNIIVKPGANLIIEGGKIKSAHEGFFWQGTIHVKENAELIVKDGSTIKMGGNGHILIDYFNGAAGMLRVIGSPNIILSDYDTKLEIKGDLQLMSQAQFSTTGNGYVLFNSPLPDNQCYNLIAGTNTSIDFNGTSTNHKKLEIAQPSLYMHNVNNISFANCKVVFSGTHSRLSLHYGTSGSININNALFTSSTGNRTSHRGIALYGQSNTSIQNSSFSNGYSGIHAMLTYSGAALTLNSCAFINNEKGILVNDKGINLNYCTFYNNNIAVDASAMSFSSEINHTSVYNNSHTGIKYNSASTGGLYVYHPNIYNNTNFGIDYSGSTKLSVRCGQIVQNNTGITFFNNASLNMSANESPTGGLVNMAVNYDLNIGTNGGNLLFLNNGNNNLQRNTNKMVINGNLNGYSACPTYLAAHSNRWNASNTYPVYNTDYFLIHNNICRRPFLHEVYLEDNSPNYGSCIDPPPPPLSGNGNILFSSSNINTTNYSNVALSDALNDAVTFAESGNHTTAMERLFEILNYPLLSTNSADDYFLRKAYLYMKQSMGHVLESYAASSISSLTLDELANKLQIIQNNIISQTQNDTSAYKLYFYTSLDKALSYRAVGAYSNAISSLNQILSWVKSENMDEINKWLCLTQLESDVIDSIVRKEDFFDLKQLCDNTFSLKTTPDNTGENSEDEDLLLQEVVLNTKLLSENTPIMTVTPNPVTNQSLINVYVPELKGNVVIRIFDVLGTLHKEIKITEIQSNIRISNTSFKDGIYQFVLMQGNNVLDNVRVVFVKD